MLLQQLTDLRLRLRYARKQRRAFKKWNDFQSIYSIELSDRFFHAAKKRFFRQPHVHILHGDSGEKLGELMSKIKVPAVFWLDGHYSAGTTARGALDCPVYLELGHKI